MAVECTALVVRIRSLEAQSFAIRFIPFKQTVGSKVK